MMAYSTTFSGRCKQLCAMTMCAKSSLTEYSVPTVKGLRRVLRCVGFKPVAEQDGEVTKIDEIITGFRREVCVGIGRDLSPLRCHSGEGVCADPAVFVEVACGVRMAEVSADDGVAPYVPGVVYAGHAGVVGLTLHPGQGDIEVVDVNDNIAKQGRVVDVDNVASAVVAGEGSVPGVHGGACGTDDDLMEVVVWVG